MSIIRRRLRFIAIALCLLAGMVVVLMPSGSALDIPNRSLRIDSSEPGVDTTHTFEFTYPSINILGSVVFEYCTSPLVQLVCTAPAGVDVSGAILDSQSGETGYSVQSTSANRIVISRQNAVANMTPSTYSFTDVVNPSNVDKFFVRISTHSSQDGSGSAIDEDAVVSSTATTVDITSEVPPYLEFCVGVDIDTNCDSVAGDTIDLGVLSPNETSRGSSEMLAATNADFGLAITAAGRTMTSGNNEIARIEDPEPSQPGTSQFGINLRSNTAPFIGADPVGGGIAIPEVDYNIPNQFVFRENDVVATSPDVTDIRHFTVSYIVNVSPNQKPGNYSTTVTFICTATF